MSFISELDQVKLALLKFMEYLDETFPSVQKETAADIRLILSELLYNAVIHGNGGNKMKAVRFEAEERDGFLCCLVMDEGNGFDYTSVLKSYSCDPGRCLESEHGRGIRLAHCLADELIYMPPGNMVRFKKRVIPNG